MLYKGEDFKNWNPRYRANFFNSVGGLKSINLMASTSKAGETNLAPFFSVQHIGANPPLLSIIFRPHTVERHSLENFRDLSFATLNAVHQTILEEAHQSSAKYPRAISEFKVVGLQEHCTEFPVPYVKEAKLRIGIKHQAEYVVELNGSIIVIASIEEVDVAEEAILSDGLIEHSLLNTLTVNGLDSYYKPEPYKRLSYARPNEPLKQKPWSKD